MNKQINKLLFVFPSPYENCLTEFIKFISHTGKQRKETKKNEDVFANNNNI